MTADLIEADRGRPALDAHETVFSAAPHMFRDERLTLLQRDLAALSVGLRVRAGVLALGKLADERVDEGAADGSQVTLVRLIGGDARSLAALRLRELDEVREFAQRDGPDRPQLVAGDAR